MWCEEYCSDSHGHKALAQLSLILTRVLRMSLTQQIFHHPQSCTADVQFQLVESKNSIDDRVVCASLFL